MFGWSTPKPAPHLRCVLCPQRARSDPPRPARPCTHPPLPHPLPCSRQQQIESLRALNPLLANVGGDPNSYDLGLRILDPPTGTQTVIRVRTSLPPGFPESARPTMRIIVPEQGSVLHPWVDPTTQAIVASPDLNAWDGSKNLGAVVKAVMDNFTSTSAPKLLKAGQQQRMGGGGGQMQAPQGVGWASGAPMPGPYGGATPTGPYGAAQRAGGGGGGGIGGGGYPGAASPGAGGWGAAGQQAPSPYSGAGPAPGPYHGAALAAQQGGEGAPSVRPPRLPPGGGGGGGGGGVGVSVSGAGRPVAGAAAPRGALGVGGARTPLPSIPPSFPSLCALPTSELEALARDPEARSEWLAQHSEGAGDLAVLAACVASGSQAACARAGALLELRLAITAQREELRGVLSEARAREEELAGLLARRQAVLSRVAPAELARELQLTVNELDLQCTRLAETFADDTRPAGEPLPLNAALALRKRLHMARAKLLVLKQCGAEGGLR